MDTTLSKTLITGAGGMVGQYIDFGIRTTHQSLDITDADAVRRMCDTVRPKVIVHLAAETDVDRCEAEPAHAYLVNTIGTYNLACAAKACGALFIYISTAAVFDGEKKGAYKVSDEPAPPHHYGRSKHAGELIVRAISKEHLIVRAGWMFGGGPSFDKKFVAKILHQLTEPSLKAVNDKIGSPTYAKDLIAGIKRLIKEGKRGTFHMGNTGSATRYDIAKFLQEVTNSSTDIIPVDSGHFTSVASRGYSEALVSDGSYMRPWREALREYVESEWQLPITESADCIRRKTCRVCGSSQLFPVLDLGAMPLANAFLVKSELAKKEKRFPLRLFFCGTCTLVQLLDVVSPEILFKHYDYLTSASAPLVSHFEQMGDELVKKYKLSRKDLVIEIGSNDGALLAHIKDRVKTLGIDPAQEAAELAQKRGVDTLITFLNDKAVATVHKKYGPARLVIANNVMAHIDDIEGAFRRLRELLQPDGMFVFEVHWVGNLIREGGFDQIYHEHLCYYSLHALKVLLERTGFFLADAQLVPIHGTSLRVHACAAKVPLSRRARVVLAKERERKLHKLSTYKGFADRVGRVKTELRAVLAKLQHERRMVVGYGAPAKGNTLLNYCGIDTDLLEYIVDSTPFKQGKFTPGTHIPILEPAMLAKKAPSHVLLLAWNYADDILKKESSLRKLGTRFILPVPKVRIV